jgi:tetratricopeptide (TPR) repeat protein
MELKSARGIRKMILALAIAVPLTLLACASSGVKAIDRAQPHLDRGVQAMEAGDHAGAIREFSIAVETHPDFAEAYYRRGCARLRLVLRAEIAQEGKEIEKAVEDLTAALRILPIYHEASYNRGLAYVALGRYRDAAQDLQNSLQTRDADLARDAHMRLGQILEEKFEGLQAAAIRHYEKYVELGGKDAGVHERLAKLKAAEAESTRRVALEAEASALLLQAMKEAQTADKAKALATLEKAIATGALPKDKREFAATAFAQWKLEAEAESAAGALFKEARGLVAEGNRALAIQILERAVSKYPNTRTVREEVTPLLRSLREGGP